MTEIAYDKTKFLIFASLVEKTHFHELSKDQ